jgi:hypothetical protein
VGGVQPAASASRVIVASCLAGQLKAVERFHQAAGAGRTLERMRGDKGLGPNGRAHRCDAFTGELYAQRVSDRFDVGLHLGVYRLHTFCTNSYCKIPSYTYTNS